MTTPARPWTPFFPPGTPADLGPLEYAHLPAAIRDASATYASQPAFTLALPNGSQGGITFGDVDRLSDQLAVYLREAAGFKAGDRVAIQMPNCLAYPIAVFGTLKAGLIMVNTNPLYTTAEMVHQFTDSGATGLIVIDLFADKVAAVLPKTAIKKVVVVKIADLLPPIKRLLIGAVQKYVKKMVPPITFDHVPLARALAQGRDRIAAGADPRVYARALDHNAIAALQYTGGTTGVAKGAVLTHGNLLANTIQGLEMWKPFLRLGQEVMLTALPLYHIFAFTANLMIFYLAGGRNVLVPSPRPLSNLKTVMTTEPITWFTGVNTLFAGLMHEPWFKEKSDWQLRGSVAGGMALVPVIGERWEAMTKTPIYQGYGLTETSPVATLNPFHRPKREAIGIPIPSTDVRFVGNDGQDVAFGEIGELWVKGPQVMQGYWQRPDETAAVLHDGWLATGDIARMDDEGYIQIVDRKKDMILVSGFNVYPNEVEAVLATHPGVADTAVVGVPDDECGEIVVAFVTKKDPAVTEDAIRQHCKQSLTGYKVPRMVVFKDDLPKSNVGKVLRKDLREEARQAYLRRRRQEPGPPKQP
ncbi:MAG TPA: AMP-binding protein [Vicinamibacterales bacterium]|nr:AMP-binding protein [Vicinamibacterales bacterium]